MDLNKLPQNKQLPKQDPWYIYVLITKKIKNPVPATPTLL